ncbi:MAG: acyl-phosphate glycerol 3-phosphate acyltransferase, partial [Anaerolineae bacterium]|nr:acyl-phosphate glycerol 3-phosphate acyltransferase [Anaerolineae bacterium]
MVSGLLVFVIALAAYLIGSIPFGWVFVKLINGRDVRFFASGRTGGTNAMRAAGPVAGILTGLMDILKGMAAGWMAEALAPGVPILKVL